MMPDVQTMHQTTRVISVENNQLYCNSRYTHRFICQGNYEGVYFTPSEGVRDLRFHGNNSGFKGVLWDFSSVTSTRDF